MGQTGGVRARAHAAPQMTQVAVPNRKHPAPRSEAPASVRGVRKIRAAYRAVSQARAAVLYMVQYTYFIPINRQRQRAHVPQPWCRPERPDK
jgi:hypothetical protein